MDKENWLIIGIIIFVLLALFFKKENWRKKMIITMFLIILFLIVTAIILTLAYTIYFYKDDYDYELNKEIFEKNIQDSKNLIGKILIYYTEFFILTANWLLELKNKYKR